MAILLAVLALAAPPFKATFTASTHTPKVNANWVYTIHLSDRAGHPLRGRLTVRVVDPFGISHPVEFGRTTKDIVNWPFRGAFHDFAQWPAESRGFTLTVRATIRALGSSVTLTYKVKPQ